MADRVLEQAKVLADELRERIRREGPMPVEAYMRACLQDPVHGYYRTRPAIGAAGDFTTAPEISQVFGELIGIWCAVAWRSVGSPAALDLIELGPGRGTMMRDALRAARIVPGFVDAVRIHLVESNAALRQAQARTLQGVAARVSWIDSLEGIEGTVNLNAPASIILGNEFLDALPIRQLVYERGRWLERCVGLADGDRFDFVAGNPVQFDDPSLPAARPREGDVLETRPELAHLVRLLRQRSAKPVAALMIDYGHLQTGFGDTLQAVHAHRYCSPLENPGFADLTAQVDFELVARLCAAEGLEVDGPVTQSEFLLRMGLAERVQKLMAHARPEQIGIIETGAARIADPMGMGGRFKVMCIRSGGMPVLPPFAPAPAKRREQDGG